MNFLSKTKLLDTEDRDQLLSSIKAKNGLTKLSHRSSIRPSTSLKKSLLRVKSLRLGKAGYTNRDRDSIEKDVN